MKTTIIELLNKIANGEEPPKKIKYADEVLEYDGYKIDYVDSDGDGLFNEYAWITELNDEVEILETTITYKQDTIEKVDEPYESVIFKTDYDFATELEKKIIDNIELIRKKQDEIIDRWNNQL